MSKDYRHDPIKKKWRDEKGRFINKHRKSFPRSRDMKVMCFPGEEALDIDLYESKGIARKNIVGIEADRRKAAAIERRKPGVQVYRGMDYEFLAETDEKYDIIDLDYECPYDVDAENSIITIASRHLLKPVSLLFQNFLGQREQKILQKLMKSLTIGKLAIKDTSKIVVQAKPDRLEKIDNLEYVRDKCLTESTILSLHLGADHERINPLLDRCPDKDSIVGALPRKVGSYELGYETVEKVGEGELLNKLIAYLQSLGVPTEIGGLAIHYYRRPYFVEDMFRFYYVSSGGSKMMGDFFLLNQKREILDKYEDFAKVLWIGGDKPFLTLMGEKSRVDNPNITERQIIKRGERFVEGIQKDCRALNKLESKFKELPDRIYLGSSARRETLTGKLYYECSVLKGMTDDGITDAYKLPERGSIASFKAHARMGTYGEVPNEWFERHKEDKNHGKAQKIEIARRLAAGENEAKLEREYGKPLAGIKAAMKRGAYEGLLDLGPGDAGDKEPEPKKKREWYEDVIPPDYFNRLSDNARLRIRYFMEDDLQSMNKKDKSRIFGSIYKSRWYKKMNQPSDMEVYTFFDDLMLAANRGERMTRESVRSLWNYH